MHTAGQVGGQTKKEKDSSTIAIYHHNQHAPALPLPPKGKMIVVAGKETLSKPKQQPQPKQ